MKFIAYSLFLPFFGFVVSMLFVYVTKLVNKGFDYLFYIGDSLRLNALESNREKTIKLTKRILLYYLIGWIGVLLYLAITNTEYILDFLPIIDSRFVED